MTTISFVLSGSGSASDLPRDIDGNVWGESLFVKLDSGETKFEGTHRIILDAGDSFFSYGSELKDGKHPIVSGDKYVLREQPKVNNFGQTVWTQRVEIADVQDMWIMEYHSTSSNADRYTICLSDGATYLKDNTGPLPTSGGDMSVTTDKSKATAWDMRKGPGISYTFGHDRDSADPHFVINDESDGRISLDLSRKTTYNFHVYMEMPWYKTTFCYENGTEYKQDTRQIYGFAVPAGPNKTGYTFLGWSETKGGTVVYKAGDILTPKESKSYYPVYAANKYSVRFYYDSTMSGDYTEQSFTYDRSQALAATPYSSPTARFLGWQDATNSSKTYDDGEVVKNLTPAVNGIVKLYGIWDEHSYTVAYSANYGTGSAASVTVKYSESIQLPGATEFTREGYKLVGWNTKPDGSGIGFAPDRTTNRLTTDNGVTVTLYAIWESVHNHIAGVWETTIPATCTDSGERVKKCTDCGAVLETESITALGHKEGSYSVINKAASCNGKGEKAWYCERCGCLVRTEAVSPTGHTPGKPVTTVSPTCTTEGIRVTKCDTCGAVLKEEPIDALGHTRGNYITLKYPTCTEDGIMQEVCPTCGIVISEKKSTQHTHTAGIWETVKYATCTDSGERVKKCTVCDIVLETESITALGHKEGSYSVINKAASCNGKGEKAWYCERCGCLVRTEAVSPTGHTPGKPVTTVSPTCTTEGIRVTKCDTCGAVLKEEPIDALGHTRGNYITLKYPTCTEDGIMQEVCPTCGIVISEKKSTQHTHTAGIWETVKYATCTDSGERVKKCTVCDIVMETEITDALGHKEGNCSIINQSATCNGMGEKVWYCERCGNPVRTEAVSPNGHNPGVAVTAFLPTCTAEGIRTISCDDCGVVLSEEKIPALGHTCGSFVTVKSPNCTEDGIKQQVCSTCGIVISEIRIPATGHSGEVWVTTVEPTCVRQGEKVSKCTSCGNILKTEVIEPLGHTSENIKTCADGATCSVCGITLGNADGSSHTWTVWKTYKEASFFSDGQERRFCTTCGDEEFRTVDGSAIGRKYIPAIIIGAAVLILGGIAALIIYKKKKSKH